MVDLAGQVAALDAELGPLQTAHDAVYRLVAQFEAENKHKNLKRPTVAKPRDSAPQVPPDSDDPPLIHHSYFDDSIRHFFHDLVAATGDAPTSTHNQETVLKHIDLRMRGAHHALEELVWRLGGVTAFPINDRLYDNTANALMGLRFDVLAHATGKFLQPHYIILRRREDKDGRLRWLVFRYTTPAYVPLSSFTHLLDQDRLADFVDLVRACLVRIQYKHDKWHAVGNLTYGDVFGADLGLQSTKLASVSTDLECARVSVELRNLRDQVHLIEIQCGEVAIQTVSCKLAHATPNQNLFAETSLANCNITHLASTFIALARYMRQHELL